MKDEILSGKKSIMIVPEQYSHEAEREALRICGPSFSLYGEVLSFSRLAQHVAGEVGAYGDKPLSQGGKLLCMAMALDAVGSRLKIYASARRKPELQQSLLSTIDELKTACIGPQTLSLLSQDRQDSLGDKLEDLSLVFEAYEAIIAQSGADPTDALTHLCENLHFSELREAAFFIDGFVDFTAQESTVIERLLNLGAMVTICLTMEGFDEGYEIFEPSRRAAAALCRIAQNARVPCQTETIVSEEDSSPVAFIEKYLFSFDSRQMDADGAVELKRANSIAEECEAAAARCKTLVREIGCRYRDIAIAVRGYEDYSACLEGIMARYGVPIYSATKVEVMEKPLPLLISSAFEIICGGWKYESVITYLRTGLTGLDISECDELDSYAFLWSVKGSAWYRASGWTLHPAGYGLQFSEEDELKLERLNDLRQRVAAPLFSLAERGKNAKTAKEQCLVLTQFFRDISLPQTLQRRKEELSCLGLIREAAQYAQLWDIVVTSLEACHTVLSELEISQEDFGKLFCLILSGYDIGTIPLSLDSVMAGDFDRMRRRSIKHLIVLGCDSAAVPRAHESQGVLTDDDREQLLNAGIDIGDTALSRISREYALAYNCVTLPECSLYMSYCSTTGESGAKKPSFLMLRLSKLFDMKIEAVDLDLCRENTGLPAFELAAKADGSATGNAARAYFEAHGKSAELSAIAQASKLARGRLSKASVDALYGEKLRLSASRIDSFSACQFSYFLQYGLTAKARQPAQFAPPEMGTFMHFVLEGVSSGIAKAGGFSNANEDLISKLCNKYVEEYIHEYLDDFREKTGRFIYLFKRLAGTVRVVVSDMVQEMSRSDFEPLDFELNFGDAEKFPPIEAADGDKLFLTGIADRIDGYLHEGKLYVRVIDYKTGIKKFSLSDVWYGMGLQMLLYLFVLAQVGDGHYGHEIVPAGVLYVPARDVLISAKAELNGEEIALSRAKNLKRSGLLLDDDTILEAMEKGEKLYIPVKQKDGKFTGDSLASLEKLGYLSKHISKTLNDLASNLRAGLINAAPYFRSQSDNACRFCDYADACHFDDTHEHVRYLANLKTKDVWDKIEANAKEGETQ